MSTITEFKLARYLAEWLTNKYLQTKKKAASDKQNSIFT